MEEKKSIRIQKLISQMGLASRREAEQWILSGRIKVNGKTVDKMGILIDPERDQIEVDGKKISDAKKTNQKTVIIYKPKGYIVSKKDELNRPTIYDLPSLKNALSGLKYIGRLDQNTEGLLILSTDGELVQKLSHPKFKIQRTYQVLINSPLDISTIEKINRDGIKIKPLSSKNATSGSLYSWYQLETDHGKSNLIQELFEPLNRRVLRTIRIKFGSYELPEKLKPGEMVVLK